MAGGRPAAECTKWYIEQAEAAARRGLSRKEITQQLGISLNLLYKWMNTNKEFKEALKNGKTHSLNIIENELFKAAQEHEITETRTIAKRNPETGKAEVVQVETFKRIVPANILAINTILNNRDPERWKRNPAPKGEDANKDPLMALLEDAKDRDNQNVE